MKDPFRNFHDLFLTSGKRLLLHSLPRDPTFNYKSISMDVLQDYITTWLSAGAVSYVYDVGCVNTTLFIGLTENHSTEYTKVTFIHSS